MLLRRLSNVAKTVALAVGLIAVVASAVAADDDKGYVRPKIIQQVRAIMNKYQDEDEEARADPAVGADREGLLRDALLEVLSSVDTAPAAADPEAPGYVLPKLFKQVQANLQKYEEEEARADPAVGADEDREGVPRDVLLEDAPALGAEASDGGQDEAGSGAAPRVYWYEYPRAARLDRNAELPQTTFEYKGKGHCADTRGNQYQWDTAHASAGVMNIASECQNHCISRTSKIQFLVGFEWKPSSCRCSYDKTIYSSTIPDDWTGYMGSPIGGVTSDYRCYARRHSLVDYNPN